MTMLGVCAFIAVLAFIGVMGVGSTIANLAFMAFCFATAVALVGVIVTAILVWRLDGE